MILLLFVGVKVLDKNSLIQGESIEKPALCVKGKLATKYRVFGLGYGAKAWEGCQPRS